MKTLPTRRHSILRIIGRQDPFTGRIGERPIDWPCRIGYALIVIILFFTLAWGFFR